MSGGEKLRDGTVGRQEMAFRPEDKGRARALVRGSPIDHTCAGQGFVRLHLPEIGDASYVPFGFLYACCDDVLPFTVSNDAREVGGISK